MGKDGHRLPRLVLTTRSGAVIALRVHSEVVTPDHALLVCHAGPSHQLFRVALRPVRPSPVRTPEGQRVVAQVAFRDEASATLLSGSADGQLAVFDLSGGLDEDEAFEVSRRSLRDNFQHEAQRGGEDPKHRTDR